MKDIEETVAWLFIGVFFGACAGIILLAAAELGVISFDTKKLVTTQTEQSTKRDYADFTLPKKEDRY